MRANGNQTPMTFEEKAARFKEMVAESKRIVFFGGAGVSTASGIPDFRSSGGLYSENFGQLPPETILSHSFFMLHPDIFFDFYRKYMLYPEAKPNICHLKLAELEKQDKLRGIVTQNIDGLHRAAGNIRVYELHGTVYENECMECGQEYPLAKILETEGVPRCSCGGVIKPRVVLYEEPLNNNVVIGALREIANADMLIVAGTSLAVYPAAGFIQDFRGKYLVVLNRDATSADASADLVIHDDLTKVFAALD